MRPKRLNDIIINCLIDSIGLTPIGSYLEWHMKTERVFSMTIIKPSTVGVAVKCSDTWAAEEHDRFWLQNDVMKLKF